MIRRNFLKLFGLVPLVPLVVGKVLADAVEPGIVIGGPIQYPLKPNVADVVDLVTRTHNHPSVVYYTGDVPPPGWHTV